MPRKKPPVEDNSESLLVSAGKAIGAAAGRSLQWRAQRPMPPRPPNPRNQENCLPKTSRGFLAVRRKPRRRYRERPRPVNHNFHGSRCVNTRLRRFRAMASGRK